MILAHVKHFLSEKGILIFPEWFKNTAEILKQQEGFTSFRYAIDPSDGNCINLWIEFANAEKIKEWANTPLHAEVVSLLDPYRLKPWEATKYEIKDNINNVTLCGET